VTWRQVVQRLAIYLSLFAFFVYLLPANSTAQQKKRNSQPAAALTAAEMASLEAVIKTDAGEIRFEFLADKAPRHAQEFIKRARAGFYDGSAFHRMVARGIVQGGDPLLKDPKTPRDRWGSGALNQMADEFSDIKHIRGTVSTARIPDKVNSGGAQFFICVSPQPQLDGQYSAFGQVTEGMDVVEKISLAETDKNQLAVTPVKIISLRIEPKRVEPFKDATPDQMRRDVLLMTSLGEIIVEMRPDLAPEHVRSFLKLVQSGWYDHTAFHRIVPGFVAQGGIGTTRAGGASHFADRWVHKLKGEFSRENHVRGVLSMARGNDPDSAETSFFIVFGPAPHLDNQYTIFGKVVSGFDTLDKIERVARVGESPVERIEIIEAAIKP